MFCDQEGVVYMKPVVDLGRNMVVLLGQPFVFDMYFVIVCLRVG